MKLLERLRLIFSQDIDKYFRSSRRMFVPIVKGGMWVDHETALCLSAVFAAVRYISQSVASLPWELRQRRRDGGSDLALSNNVYRLLHTRPNPYMSSFDFRVWLLSRANLWGNAYAEIERDIMERPLALWPIAPERVTPKNDPEIGLHYEITQRNAGKLILFPEQIFHLRGLGDELQGYSVVGLAARSIGAGLARDEFAASFYENSTVISGVLKHPKAMGDKAYDRLKKELKEKKQGPRNAWHPWILEEGMDWQTMGMPLKDAQFIESGEFTVNDMARWFGVSSHKIGDLRRATYSNIEHQSIEDVQNAIIPWAIRLEQEADYKLISPRSRSVFYSKLNVNGLLRGDSRTRAEFYKILRNLGALNANEIRAFEDMNPIGKDGDKYVMQGQYTTLEKIGKDPEPNPFQIEAPKESEEGEEEEKEAKAAWRLMFYDALERVYERRQKRFEDVEKNMPDDKWAAWIKKFEKEHTQYLIKSLRSVFLGYAKASEITDAGALDICLQNISKLKIEDPYSKEDLWNMADRIIQKINELKENNYAITETA